MKSSRVEIVGRYLKWSRGFFLLLAVVMVAGCYTGRLSTRLSPYDVIWSPATVFGREYRSKHEDRLVELVRQVQSSPDLVCVVRLNRNGLRVGNRPGDPPEANYLGLHLSHLVVFNTLQTSFLSRAASSFMNSLYPLARILATHPELFDDERMVGVGIKLDWQATNFVDDKYKLHSETEYVDAWIPWDALCAFASSQLSLQDLQRRSIFTCKIGRTELDFTRSIP